MAGKTILKTWYHHNFKVCIQNIHTKAGEDYSANAESQVGHLSSRQQQSIKPRLRLFLHFLNWVMPLARVPPLVVPFSKLDGSSAEIPRCILSSQPTPVLLLPCLSLCIYWGAASRLCCYQQCCLKAVSSHRGEYQTPQAGCNRNTSVNTSLLALSRYTLFTSLSLLTRLASAASPASLKCQMWRSSSASSPGTVFVPTPATVWKKFLLKESTHRS